MSVGSFDFSLATATLSKIQAERLEASPENYTLWYTYLSGKNKKLCQEIDSLYSRGETVSQGLLDAVFRDYFSENPEKEKIEHIGNQLAGEIDVFLGTVQSAYQSNKNYEGKLQVAESTFSSTVHPTQKDVEGAVQVLLIATREMQSENKNLQTNLLQTQGEMNVLKQNLQNTRAELYLDPLTSLFNRKRYDAAILQSISSAREHGTPLSLLIADIDFFKSFNDKFGHLVGDQVLRLVGKEIRGSIREEDIACRYGGEEFVVIMPNTALEAAIALAERIRSAVSSKEILKRSTVEVLGRVTLSIGVTSLQPEDKPESFYERADACLYKAKNQGRNQVQASSTS